MKLAENIAHFARALRRAGITVGPDRVLDGLRALQIAGIERREDFYWTLASVFLSRREHFELFDQAFKLFWRERHLLEQAMPALPSATGMKTDPNKAPNRIAEALGLTRKMPMKAGYQDEEPEVLLSASDLEKLQRKDFETMTSEELAEAKKLIAGLRLPIPEVATRRLHPDARGRHVDLRATLRASLRGNADVIPLRRRSVRKLHPPLVVLCDISGSMSRYSRMFLHFLHAITNDRDRVQSFVFGTRLTNITRQLRHRDVDVALNAVSGLVEDWSGGTRIGATLKEFNQRWSRRVLGQNAVVMLISDGLDRDPGDDLGKQIERLHKSCHQLIWLNPLLRFEDFEPKAAGVKLMLPHVDAFLPAHNIDSLTDLARSLRHSRPSAIAA
ncbi:MAG TPA: VWA domain-containing protein [Burkholderiales bacterium]|nr:VWA domain-containing protein [Burkholderiales bacterium]